MKSVKNVVKTVKNVKAPINVPYVPKEENSKEENVSVNLDPMLLI